MAVGALAFKQWLDNLFHSKKIEGNLVEDHRGLRVYGLFDQTKGPEANKFIQEICSYDWGPAAATLPWPTLPLLKPNTIKQ